VHLEHNADAGLRLRQLLRAEFLFHFDPAISPPSAGPDARQRMQIFHTQAHLCYSQDVSIQRRTYVGPGRTAGLSARGKLRLTCASCHPSCSRSTRTLLNVRRKNERRVSRLVRAVRAAMQVGGSSGRARGAQSAVEVSVGSATLRCRRRGGLCLWGVFLFVDVGLWCAWHSPSGSRRAPVRPSACVLKRSIWLPLREVLTPFTSGGVSCVGARVRPGFQGQIVHAHARGPDFAKVAGICGSPRVEQRQPVSQGRPLSLQRVRNRCSQKRAFEEAESQLRGAAPDGVGRDGGLYLPHGNPQYASPPGHHIRA